MCLAVPMKITEISGDWGVAELAGVRQRVNLQLLEQASVNTYVLIHAGFAIQQIKETEALEILELLSGAAEADTQGGEVVHGAEDRVPGRAKNESTGQAD